MSAKVALITGGAQGIGRGIAERLLSSSPRWDVVIVDRDAYGIDDFIEHVTKKRGVPADQYLTFHGDCGKKATASGAIAAAIARFHRLDLLVNNAGGGGLHTALETLSEEAWHDTINANLSSAFFFSQAAAPHLEATRGSIVNISSTRAVMSEPDSFAYAAAKGGVESLTHAFAASLSGKVSVNCLRLGWIDVSSAELGSGRQQQSLSEKDHSQHFSGRVGTVSDVADGVLYLAASSFVCGSVITIDGGMTKKMIYSED